MMLEHEQRAQRSQTFKSSRTSSRIVAGVATVVVVAAAAAVLLFRHTEPKVEPIAIKADGIFMADIEGHPYKRDIRTGKVLLDSSGKPVKNQNYSKEDGYRGDNVCDTTDEKSELKDPAGNLLQEFRDTYTDGRFIKLPLEDENSPDCIMARVKADPCARRGQEAPLLTREKVSLPELVKNPNTRKRLRTQEEIEKLYAQPGAYRTEGGDLFTVVNDYSETIDVTLPDCADFPPEPCFCSNLYHDLCGSEGINPGEECDPSSGKPRGGCDKGERCVRCNCVKPSKTCNDGIAQPTEECDESTTSPTRPRGGCGEGYVCAECECIQVKVPEPEPPKCTPSDCDTSRVKPGPLVGRLLRSVDASQLRKDLGCSDDISLSASFFVSPEGVPSQRGAISASCGGQTTKLDNPVNMSNVKVGASGDECGCILPVPAEIPKEGRSG
ncbi:MAG: hypothetical protein PHF60_00210 [Candidatus ainarchaeum sp.]|nr:hypothetical protein [Candidatus ainarchaeum sp.]